MELQIREELSKAEFNGLQNSTNEAKINDMINKSMSKFLKQKKPPVNFAEQTRENIRE